MVTGDAWWRLLPPETSGDALRVLAARGVRAFADGFVALLLPIYLVELGRQITPDHARIVAETGGSVGIWHLFPSLDKFVEGMTEMVDVVGVDHVSIGTDQQAAPGSLQDYSQWVHLVAAMLRAGFTPEETGKIVGGNYMRIFNAALA